MDDKAKITSVARRALQLLKNRSFAELAEISSTSIKAQMYELTSQPPDHTSWFFESEDGQAVLRWNGVLSPDVLFEATDSTIYAQVLFAKEVQQDDELNTERFFFVRLVSEGDEWRFLQTACANGEEVREHTSRAKTSIKEAKEAYRSSLTGSRLLPQAWTTQTIPAPNVQVEEPTKGDRSPHTPENRGVYGSENRFLSVRAVEDQGSSLEGSAEGSVQGEEDYWDRFPKQVSESEYEAEQRREAALVAVQGAMGGVWRLAAMLGLNAEQFVACAKDICMPYGGHVPLSLSLSSPPVPATASSQNMHKVDEKHIIDIVQAIHDLNALTS